MESIPPGWKDKPELKTRVAALKISESLLLSKWKFWPQQCSCVNCSMGQNCAGSPTMPKEQIQSIKLEAACMVIGNKSLRWIRRKLCESIAGWK